MLATPGALKTVERIREKAAVERAQINQEMSGVADLLSNLELQFFTKAGETGKLYGSITTQMVVDEVNKKLGTSLDRHQIELAPIRNLGEHLAVVRLTVDLMPKIKVLVNREGEAAKVAAVKAQAEKVAIAVESATPEVEIPEEVEADVIPAADVVEAPVEVEVDEAAAVVEGEAAVEDAVAKAVEDVDTEETTTESAD